MLQHINLAEVKIAARKAYDAGNLLAQHPEKATYFYRRADICCAIGACLTPETLAIIDDNGFECEVVQAVDYGDGVDSAFTMSESEREYIIDIQSAHDQWANAVRGKRETSELKARFLDLLI